MTSILSGCATCHQHLRGRWVVGVEVRTTLWLSRRSAAAPKSPRSPRCPHVILAPAEPSAVIAYFHCLFFSPRSSPWHRVARRLRRTGLGRRSLKALQANTSVLASPCIRVSHKRAAGTAALFATATSPTVPQSPQASLRSCCSRCSALQGAGLPEAPSNIRHYRASQTQQAVGVSSARPPERPRTRLPEPSGSFVCGPQRVGPCHSVNRANPVVPAPIQASLQAAIPAVGPLFRCTTHSPRPGIAHKPQWPAKPHRRMPYPPASFKPFSTGTLPVWRPYPTPKAVRGHPPSPSHFPLSVPAMTVGGRRARTSAWQVRTGQGRSGQVRASHGSPGPAGPDPMSSRQTMGSKHVGTKKKRLPSLILHLHSQTRPKDARQPGPISLWHGSGCLWLREPGHAHEPRRRQNPGRVETVCVFPVFPLPLLSLASSSTSSCSTHTSWIPLASP